MSEIITVIAVTPGMPCPEVHQFHPTHTPVPTTMRVGCKWPYLHPVFADFPSAKGSSFTQGYPMSTLDPSCPSAAQSMPDRHGAWRLAPYLKVGYASRSNLCSRAPRRSRPSWNLTKQIPLLPPRPLLNTSPPHPIDRLHKNPHLKLCLSGAWSAQSSWWKKQTQSGYLIYPRPKARNRTS